jgi:UDP-glucuronate decarboxylase
MIRWITDSLGTAAWDGLDAPLDTHILDARDLLDKEGNAPPLVKSKINEALDHLRSGQKVIVCCDYGMSRSNAIAAGILAAHEAVDFEQAVRRVIGATGEKAIKIAVLSAVREALGEKSESGTARQGAGRRLLVTGASGFIGSSVIGELQRNYEVMAPTRQEIDLLRDTVALDLLVRERGIDTVLHLGNPSVYTSNESMGMSLVMLKNVLDVCAENGLLLVYLSGWEIYSGYKTRELKADETLAPCPGGTYGQTKFLCETLLRHYHQHYGVAYALLRSSPVYGPGSDRPKFIWNFLQKALRNEEIVAHRYLNGFPSLDLLYVDDLCAAILAAIERRVQGVINLGTGIATSTTEIAQRIVERVGSRSVIRHHDISGYAGNIVMDINRAVEMLGWRPEIDLARGLENIIRVGLNGQVPPSGNSRHSEIEPSGL